MRNFIIILILFSSTSCSTYSVGDLNGKWECIIEESPFELWISDSLAIGFDFDNQIMILYRISYDGNIISFTHISPWEGSTWKGEVISLDQNEFKLELQNPSNKRVTKYIRSSDKLPKFSDNYETNFECFESYMIEKVSSLNIS